MNIKRIASIKRHRKRKNLCLFCGKDPEYCKEHSCNETYEKSDTRVTQEKVMVKEYSANDRRKTTVKTYRRKYFLCEQCGLDSEECLKQGCPESYASSDMRKTEAKKKIKNSKKKKNSILSDIENIMVRREFLKISKDPIFKISPAEDFSIRFNFILIDLNTHSDSSPGFTFNYCNFMTSKYHNKHIFFLGDISKYFSLFELDSLKKIVNVGSIKNISDQNIVSYILECDRFFGFPSRYSLYSIVNRKPTTVFITGDEDLGGISGDVNIIKLDENRGVDLTLVKEDAGSWKI